MSEKRNGAPLAIIGIIVISFTIVAFVMFDIERVAVYFWALVFVLLAETALFVGLHMSAITGDYSVPGSSKIRTKARFPAYPHSLSCILYLVATVVFSFFTESYKDRPGAFILINIGIIALCAIIVLALSRLGAEKKLFRTSSQ